MLNNSLGKIITALIMICMFYPAGTAFAAPGRLPSLTDVENMAKNQGIDYVKRNILGCVKVVESGASNPANPTPYLKLASEPANLPYTRVPAGEKFIIEVDFSTKGEKVEGRCGSRCSSTVTKSYIEARSPDTVRYSFLSSNGNLERFYSKITHDDITLYRCRRHSCGDDCSYYSCDGSDSCKLVERKYKYRATITVPRGTPDIERTYIEINIKGGPNLTGVTPVPSDGEVTYTGDDSAVVKIPVQIYTPAGQTFYEKKFKYRYTGDNPEYDRNCS